MAIPLSTSIIAGISLSPLISLIAGILILIMPRLLNFIVAIYLIIIGLVGVFHLVAAVALHRGSLQTGVSHNSCSKSGSKQ
jgi:hypothetical protein